MFQCVAAMMSSFLLIDSKQELWIWFNEEKCPTKYDAEWNQEGQIKLLGCSLFRATIYLKSSKFVTFYDSSFRGKFIFWDIEMLNLIMARIT